MSESISKLTKLTRENYRLLGWIAVFAVFAYFANERLVDATRQSGSMLTAVIVCLSLALTAITVMLRSISSSMDTLSAWGLRLDKEGWYILSFFAALTVVLVFAYPPVKTLPGHMTIITLTVLGMITQELVLRAFLINYLVSTMGKSRESVFIAVVVSALVVAVVHKPFLQIADGETLVSLLGSGLLFGYMYYYLRSIVVYVCFVILARVGDLLPGFAQDEMVHVLGLTLLVCLILSGAGRLVNRQMNIPSSAKPELSVGGEAS